jgi:hypothetical protein
MIILSGLTIGFSEEGTVGPTTATETPFKIGVMSPGDVVLVVKNSPIKVESEGKYVPLGLGVITRLPSLFVGQLAVVKPVTPTRTFPYVPGSSLTISIIGLVIGLLIAAGIVPLVVSVFSSMRDIVSAI